MNEYFPQGLYIIATPIGNMGDITLRALEVLRKCDAVACEDTRVTGKLLSANGLKTPKIPYHDHNAEKMRPQILKRIQEGQRIALVSDAGMPLVSDPGYKLVRECIAHDIHVTCLPGATAALPALALSGLPADRFFFAGFLPPKTSARKKELRGLAAVPGTLVFYEAAPRLASSLADMRDILGDRPAAVARELTKRFEEVRRGTLPALAAHYESEGAPKGEIAIVVGGPVEGEAEEADITPLLQKALDTMTVKDAAAAVAARTGMKKKDVYTRALQIKNDGEET